VAILHAAADKRDRKQAMEDIRGGLVRVLITSDVAARGLDIAGVASIVNFDVPTQSKAYLHRVGRTARAGATGSATTLMTPDEVRLVARFESELGIVIHPVRLREGHVIPAGTEGVAGPGGTR
jgi:superfamily II DNA/RNA helicase